MTSFVRFVFTIVIIGMAVNLAVVLVANARSARRQSREYERDLQRFRELVANVSGHARRADIIVESQRLDGHETVLESTLLVRQYRATGSSQKDPLPVVRITIPGNRLQAGGLMLEFYRNFGGQRRDGAILRNAQLGFFGLFRGDDETTPPSGDSDASFTFLPRNQVPELIRLDPATPQPSIFESGLWRFLWNVIPEPPRDAKLPWVLDRPDLGLKVAWLKPATIAVRTRNTYTAYVSADGITLSQNEPGMANLLEVMEAEGKKRPPG